MKLSELFAEEDAVSPVIGVILMVAITVILAAVIGTFVLGLGDQVQDNAPQVSFAFDYTDGSDGTSADSLDITHDSGNKVASTALFIRASGAEATDGSTSYDASVGLGGTSGADSWDDLSSGDVTAGSSVTIDGDDFLYGSTPSTADGTNDEDTANGAEYLKLDGSTVRIVWQAEGGGDTATLGKWTGPDA